jgi:hypothetical protein
LLFRLPHGTLKSLDAHDKSDGNNCIVIVSSGADDNEPSNSASLPNSVTTPSDLNRLTDDHSEKQVPTPETIDAQFNFEPIYLELRDLTESICQHFAKQNNDVCRRFDRLLQSMLHSIELSVPLTRYLIDHFHYFDYSPEVRPALSLDASTYMFVDPCQRLPFVGRFARTRC